MNEKLSSIGHIYGLNTRKGIALLQLADEPETPTSLQLTRICDGFLNDNYTDDDVATIIQKKELFFLETPLRIIKPRSKLYRTYFAFDKPFTLPKTVVLPDFQRGFVVLNDGNIKWYKKRRGSNTREFVTEMSPDFLTLSPDSSWSLPDICDFLERNKKIYDYR